MSYEAMFIGCWTKNFQIDLLLSSCFVYDYMSSYLLFLKKKICLEDMSLSSLQNLIFNLPETR